MYLEKRHYVQRWDHIDPDKQFKVSITRGDKPYDVIKYERVSYVIEQVAYWRKANQIHHWFVENVQRGEDDCQPYYCSYEQLNELFSLVCDVLAEPARAEELLPTESGFFFGGTDYDESYMLDLTETRDMLAALFAEPGAEDADYYYSASW